MDNGKPTFDLQVMKNLLRQIEETPTEIISCAEAFALLDEYVDRLARGEPVATLLPAVKYHLDLCDPCGEQYELLRAIILDETDLPAP